MHQTTDEDGHLTTEREEGPSSELEERSLIGEGVSNTLMGVSTSNSTTTGNSTGGLVPGAAAASGWAPYLVWPLVLFGGMMLPLQTALIGQLSTALGSRSRGISVSYLGGFIVALMVALLWPGQPSITKETLRSVPVAAWASGLLGLVYLAIAAYAIPIVGPAVFFGLVVTGQLTASLMLEQFGLLGTHQHSIDFWRVGGLVLVIVGVVLIRKT